MGGSPRGDVPRPDVSEPHRPEPVDQPRLDVLVSLLRGGLPPTPLRPLRKPRARVRVERDRLRLRVALLLDGDEALPKERLRLSLCDAVRNGADGLHALCACGVAPLD